MLLELGNILVAHGAPCQCSSLSILVGLGVEQTKTWKTVYTNHILYDSCNLRCFFCLISNTAMQCCHVCMDVLSVLHDPGPTKKHINYNHTTAMIHMLRAGTASVIINSSYWC